MLVLSGNRQPMLVTQRRWHQDRRLRRLGRLRAVSDAAVHPGARSCRASVAAHTAPRPDAGEPRAATVTPAVSGTAGTVPAAQDDGAVRLDHNHPAGEATWVRAPEDRADVASAPDSEAAPKPELAAVAAGSDSGAAVCSGTGVASARSSGAGTQVASPVGWLWSSRTAPSSCVACTVAAVTVTTGVTIAAGRSLASGRGGVCAVAGAWPERALGVTSTSTAGCKRPNRRRRRSWYQRRCVTSIGCRLPESTSMVSSGSRVTSPGVSSGRAISFTPRLPERASRSPRVRLSPAV